ncbi:MAG: leucine-rich repeat domain-containing protein [Bacteroidaceae bacterium]|nr:leucine-rich repeat domain-containing protein [Bacteroidaceae bacterium]
MKKNIFLYAFAALCLMAFSSCEKQSTKQDTKVVTDKEATSTPPKDIFFYTPQHRKDKYVPTEEKMGFSSKIPSINESEFEGNTSLKEVWIAPQIKHIVNRAFAGCTSLEKVHFQGELPVINDGAFQGCTALKNLLVDVYTVGVDAFKDCTSLETARFGEHIWWLRVGAFENCKKLKSVLMGITMKKIDDGAFTGCTGLEEFTVPNDFKNRMFGLVSESASKWKKVYLLSTEYYPLPKNCTPNANCTLYVPDAFLAQFKADEGWQKFGSIEPLSKTKYFTAEGFWK